MLYWRGVVGRGWGEVGRVWGGGGVEFGEMFCRYAKDGLEKIVGMLKESGGCGVALGNAGDWVLLGWVVVGWRVRNPYISVLY